jgi:hypothetical protein
MADAIITDINEYRAAKVGTTNTAFVDWSDERITSRHKMLYFIAAGHTDLTDMSAAAVRMTFPNGFDPENHLDDNIDAVYAEGVRRGVFVPSE